MTRFLLPSCLLLALSLVGCESVQTADATDQSMGSVIPEGEPMPMGAVDAPPGSPHFLPTTDPRSLTAAMEMQRGATPAMRRAVAILKSDLSVERKDRQMRQVFAMDLPRESRWLVQTTYGVDMLTLLLADPASDPEAIGFYAERLAAYRNPNADLLAAAFERLADTWSEKQRATARQEAREGALDWLQTSSCKTCRTAEALRSEYPAGQGLDARNRKILDALSRLSDA